MQRRHFMVEVGYKLSSEENGPLDLVCYAKQAEDAGFAFAMISDHYHPWIDRQGHSPFVWGVIGGIDHTPPLGGRLEGLQRGLLYRRERQNLYSARRASANNGSIRR